MNRFFHIILFAAALFLSQSLIARPVVYLPYGKMKAEADLIVIATPTNVKDTGHHTAFPDVRSTGADNIPRPIRATEMEATFEILAVLKGEEDKKSFVFRCLRDDEPKGEVFVNGLGLLTFDPKEKKRYLLFLRREGPNTYSSLTGQTDPINGIKDLGEFP